ncbi:flagellar hook-basal body protein [Sulfurimonas sp.]|nr:flagellar hook-basal body protein [Sulfurimonas sp.]
MQSGYYSSAAGMVTQFNRLDTIANNLANVNTAGFKEDNVVVGDFMRIYKEARENLPLDNNTKEAAQFLNRTITKAPQVVDAYTDHSVGTMQQTSNPLDFALTKEGTFFLVETPQGVRLTRDGSFTTDDNGELVTKDGHRVLPSDYFAGKQPITINSSDKIIKVDKDGQMYTNEPGGTGMIQGSKLFIAQPDNLALLKKDGSNLYRYEGENDFVDLEGSSVVKQGFIEKSNVNAVKMMTQMIETNRLVGMYQKAMSVQMDDMNNDAINKIARKG